MFELRVINDRIYRFNLDTGVMDALDAGDPPAWERAREPTTTEAAASPACRHEWLRYDAATRSARCACGAVAINEAEVANLGGPRR